MAMAIRIHQTGGPEEFKWEEVQVGDPGPGEVRLEQSVVGLNYIDVYHRTGLYPLPAMPAIIGLEAAGRVTAIGDGVTEVGVGDRVAYAGVPPGAYATERLIPAHRLIKMPDSISDRTAGAMMLQGMTAQYLLRRTAQVGEGDWILVHAAAGGVGLMLCQWARHLGARVIGTAGSPEKAALAKENGCDFPILYRTENFVDRVAEFTDGEKCKVVYDAIGKDTFEDSLASLAPMGMMVSYGNASGSVPPLDIARLGALGSLFITRPSLMTYTAKRDDLVASATDLIDVVSKGIVKIEVNQEYALKDAAQAHRNLEARKTTGSTVLIP
ncbi:MAG: quinone oxidoreductase family protein [Rhodospirillales bacterium]